MLCLPLLIAALANPVSPDDHAKLAATFLSDANRSIPQADKPYIRFLSWANYSGSPDLEHRQRIMRFWINSLTLESDPEFPREVAGSNGLLYWLDLRDYGWTTGAWNAVAQREPYFRQPMVSDGPAQFIRVVIGATQDPKTLHCVGIVRADWFFRETVELDRSPAYYDLLFAKQRHPDGRTETYEEDKVIDWPGGYSEYSKAVVPAGRYTIKEKKFRNSGKAEFIDFPKTEQDVEKVLGVDGIRSFIKTSGINLQHGAVVEGGEKGNSIVARQNRLLERTNGPIGYFWKTFDVRETAGRRDFAETLHKDFDFDAGEILFRLPGGGQGGLLVDAKGAVLNVADNRFAIDGSDSKDVRVRNPGSCMVCHESGIIKPANLIEEMLKAGVDIKFKDKKDARDTRSFFLGWEAKLANDQTEYAQFIKRTSGFSPAENSRNFKAFRDAYDSPIDLQKASSECGVSMPVLLQAARKSLKARVLNLVQGISMPRKTWGARFLRRNPEAFTFEETMKRFVLAMIALALGGTASLADDCVRSRAVYSAYIAPAVVSVPTYAYTASSYNYATTLLVPQVIPVETYTAHSYSIQSGYSDSQVIDAVGRLLQQERAAYQQGQQLPSQPPPVPQQPAPVQQPQLPPAAPIPHPVAQPQTSGPIKASSFQEPNLIALIQSKCVKCHSPGSKRLQLLTPDGKQLADLTRTESLTTYWLVNTGAMPKTTEPLKIGPDGKPIPDVDDKYMPLFAKWIEASK